MDVDVVASAGASAILAIIILLSLQLNCKSSSFFCFRENGGSFPKGYDMNEEVLVCKFAVLKWLLTLIGF
jgi:hypothetical protein